MLAGGHNRKYPVGPKIFSLAREDAQDKDDWKLRIREATV